MSKPPEVSASKKAEAARRVAQELARTDKELHEWLNHCDDTETTG